ncbi:MAG: hypothetical protein ACJ8FS_04430 [Sphingomicrobium sp.]
MKESLKSIILRDRAKQAVGLGLLLVLALLAALSLFWPPTYVTDGQIVEATVLRIGTYAVGSGYGGDLPIVTVRLPNGSIRQVKASWSTAGNCVPGGRVALLQRGTALQVGLRGCREPKHST